MKLNGAAESDVATLDSTADVAVSEDAKSVVITATTTLESEFGIGQASTPFNFKVKGVKTSDSKDFPSTTVELSVKDEVKPELVSASAKAATVTKSVTLTFSEPVDTNTGVFKVAGKTVSASAGSLPNQVVLSTTDNLTAGQSYEVEVTNLNDFAGNLIATNPSKLTLTVAQDSVAQSVESVTVLEDDKVKVVFNESMNVTSVQNGIAVLDLNASPKGTFNVTQVNGSTKEFYINFTAGLYATSNTENLNVVFKNTIKDAAGNAITPETKSISLSKDVLAPTVTKVEMVKNTTYTNGALVVTFDEAVKDLYDGSTTTLPTGALKVIDQDGTDITSTLIAAGVNPVLDAKDAKKLIIPFQAAVPTTSKTATVMVGSTVAKDDSLGLNFNTAKTVNGVDLTVGISDTVKPVVGNPSQVANTNNITFTITEANLDKATVQNVDNYRLDGKPLPAGSYVTITGTAPNYTAVINLPANSVDATRTNYAFTIAGIKDLAGNAADVVAVNNVSLDDDVKPVFNSVVFNSNGTVSLGFSEAITVGSADSLELKVNDSASALVDTAYAVAAGVGSEAGKAVITFETVTGTDNVVYIDVDNDGVHDAAETLALNDILKLQVTIIDGTTDFADGEGNLVDYNSKVTKSK